MINKRIEALRRKMDELEIDAYLIPSSDSHLSEYVSEHFKAREYISGFTGSAGEVIITRDKAGLWTDSRYFLQASKELSGSVVELYRLGEPDVISMEEFLNLNLPNGGKLGFDGRVISASRGISYEELFAKKNISIYYEKDLVAEIWEERPELPREKAFILTEKYSGESITQKLEKVRAAMKKQGANIHVLTTLDEICWLLNIRGRDILYSPLILAYSIVYMDRVDLYIEKSKLDEDIQVELGNCGVRLLPYSDIYQSVGDFTSTDKILLDPSKTNYKLFQSINSISAKVKKPNPIVMLKAVKNDIEIQNTIQAHIKDGVAITKFMYWLKHAITSETITEISAATKLDEFRQEGEGYLWQSFAPICAYREHAAIVHYSATEESSSELQPSHMFLADTGGNYYEGSTDITRTFVLGEISEEERLHFTLVAKSMLHVANAKFLKGVCGYNLDILAKTPMWERGLDYKHGTGHGVGHLLNVHEGPIGIRWINDANRNEGYPLLAGMIVTDEPGLYIEDSHGIRTENELLVCEGEKNEYGQFMYFETITVAPIDLDAIDVPLLTQEEKVWLNTYHKKVFDTLSPYLEKDVKEWLKEYTREV